MNIGIIGYGAFGRFLKESWETLPDAKVTYITKTKAETARDMAARDGIPKHSDDYRDLLADHEVDIVAIVTPPYLHEKIAVEAFRAGKNVLVEKPPAMNVMEAENIIREVEKAGRIGTVNFMMRYSGLIDKLCDICREKILGDLTRVMVENYASDEGLSPDHWFWDRSRSGGILVEHGVHFFDLVETMVDSRPAKVEGLASERVPGVQDKVFAAVQYKNGVIGTFYHSFAWPSAMEEQTSARYVFHRGIIDVFGWIPTRMKIRGYVSEAELHRLWEMFDDTTFSPLEPSEIVSSGVKYPIAYSVNFDYVHSVDKQVEYADCVRALMSDLIAAIRDTSHKMRVTLEDGLRSVEIAQLATAQFPLL